MREDELLDVRRVKGELPRRCGNGRRGCRPCCGSMGLKKGTTNLNREER